MFSLSLEYLKQGLSQDAKNISDSTSGSTKLTLPLERTALEQINYTKWFYSEDSKNMLNMIKKSHVSLLNGGFLELNKKENSFVLSNPLPSNQDEFYFMFDFLKDKLVDKGFELKDAIQEAISNTTNYIEVEIFFLYNELTQEHITLEIRSFKGSPLNIKGHCTINNEMDHPLPESNFFTDIKSVFSI